MITTTVRMVDGVHRDTARLGPVVSLRFRGVEGSTGFEHRLVDTTAACDDADCRTGDVLDRLFGAGRQSNASLALVSVLTDDGSVRSRGTSKRSSIAGLLLDVANDRAFRKVRQRYDIADVQSCLLAAEDERAGREAFGCNESFDSELVAVRVAEDDAGERSATTRVVDDFFDEAANVSSLFCKVKSAQFGRRFPFRGVRREDTTRLSLITIFPCQKPILRLFRACERVLRLLKSFS